ncbi:PTS sugar transporter subunit IIC [Candidatus Stoquefichus massiliensis]|uniref:PTS sugar transporter subunit IIC n=1 Tax=Candidatus Stoquefichus massiliensis TaxID=1470350 RepID=UPI000482FBD7|nr:PTS transporter subunit EIIC [Candidatus Stoquefichus massiliensis]
MASFALLFNIFICSKTGLAQFQSLKWLENYSNMFSTVNFACISCMALWLVVLMGYTLGKNEKHNPLINVLVTAVLFLVVSNQDNLLGDLGASTLFLAFFVSIVANMIFNRLLKVEKIKIKLPESVPPMIAGGFNALIPAWMTITLFGVTGGILYGMTGLYMNNIIYSVIQVPFNQVVGSQLGVSIIVLLSQLLWWTDIHGHMAMNVIAKPVRTAALATNIALVASGALPTEFYTLAYVHLFTNLGGSGIVISLALAIMVFSKRQEYKEVTKLSMIPLICGISEPMVFGLPIMLNPVFLIPFVAVSLITANIGYYAITSGFLTASYVESIAGMPMFIQQFLAFSGQWQALFLTVVVVVVGFVIYAPFVIMSNKINPELSSESKENH